MTFHSAYVAASVTLTLSVAVSLPVTMQNPELCRFSYGKSGMPLVHTTAVGYKGLDAEGVVQTWVATAEDTVDGIANAPLPHTDSITAEQLLQTKQALLEQLRQLPPGMFATQHKRASAWINAFNLFLQQCVRCNIDTKAIWSGKDARALAFY